MADTWKVTNQRQTTAMVGNAWVPSMEVTFETLSGTVGSVTVPVAGYSAQVVHDAIAARVEQIDAVTNL